MVEDSARQLIALAPASATVRVYGPAPAPLSRIRDKYRVRLLVHTHRQENIQKAVSSWISSVKIPSAISVRVDIDPHSFL